MYFYRMNKFNTKNINIYEKTFDWYFVNYFWLYFSRM